MITKADLVPGRGLLRRPDQPRPRAGLGRDAAHRCPPRGDRDRAGIAWASPGWRSRLSSRMAEDAVPLAGRGVPLPAQVESLEGALKLLVETVFGESRYEEAPWLRGFYFTSAAQEGSPIDRMLMDMAGAYGLRADPPPRRAAGEQRSYFLHDLLSEVIFPEAGLGQFDRAAEERRVWIWRGSVAAAALAVTLAGLGFLYSYLNQSGVVADQARLTADLSQRLANVALAPGADRSTGSGRGAGGHGRDRGAKPGGGKRVDAGRALGADRPRPGAAYRLRTRAGDDPGTADGCPAGSDDVARDQEPRVPAGRAEILPDADRQGSLRPGFPELLVDRNPARSRPIPPFPTEAAAGPPACRHRPGGG